MKKRAFTILMACLTAAIPGAFLPQTVRAQDTDYSWEDDTGLHTDIDMNQVSFPASVSFYNTGYENNYGDDDSRTVSIPITGANGAFDGYQDCSPAFPNTENFDITSSGSEISIVRSPGSLYYDSLSYISQDVLYVPLKGTGQTTLTLTLNGRTYQIHVTIYKVRLTSSVLIARGKTRNLNVSGISQSKVRWSSSNKKAVTVNKTSGKIRAKKNGNAIIYAKVGNVKLGSAVSVTSAKKVKAIKHGFHIAKTCSYSQAKRMQSGYYDCSSLVWKSYHYAKGCNFGSSSYAPTSASEASYLAKKKRIIGNYTDENVKNMKFQAGDVLFKTGENNGRYKGVYHAELFAGYSFAGFSENYETHATEPYILTRWCARQDGYGGWEQDIVGRP